METPKITINRINKYLAEGKRFDGRKPEEFRDLEIEFGVSKKAEGSARVKLGKTEVIVGVKMGVAEPYPDSPNKGNLMVTAELLPLSSSRFESGPPQFEAIELGRLVDRGIREGGFIEFEKLCIKEGEKVWTLFVDVYTINDDGNLLDASGIGALAALKMAEIPKYDEKENKVLYGESSGKKIPLTKEIPLSITAYKIGDKILVDPTREEEDAGETRVTIGISNGVISSMQKGNEIALDTDTFAEILEMIEKVWKDLNSKIEKFIK
jgi:exosome complex component RRP42